MTLKSWDAERVENKISVLEVNLSDSISQCSINNVANCLGVEVRIVNS